MPGSGTAMGMHVWKTQKEYPLTSVAQRDDGLHCFNLEPHVLHLKGCEVCYLASPNDNSALEWGIFCIVQYVECVSHKGAQCNSNTRGVCLRQERGQGLD